MILLSLHPGPPSETSAFRRMRAFSSRLAGPLPLRTSACSCSRSCALNRTTYFFTAMSFPAMIPSAARIAARANHLILSNWLKLASRMNRVAVLYALLSAALFGISTPAAKSLVGSVSPAILAGLLYCGAGIGVAVLRRVKLFAASGAPEVALSTPDWPWLCGAIVAGGVIGPLLLMVGLTHTSAAAASLLLTLEGAATALIAWFVFHENFDRRIALGMICIVAGAMILSWVGA